MDELVEHVENEAESSEVELELSSVALLKLIEKSAGSRFFSLPLRSVRNVWFLLTRILSVSLGEDRNQLVLRDG